jgi:hypothetical protein
VSSACMAAVFSNPGESSQRVPSRSSLGTKRARARSALFWRQVTRVRAPIGSRSRSRSRSARRRPRREHELALAAAVEIEVLGGEREGVAGAVARVQGDARDAPSSRPVLSANEDGGRAVESSNSSPARRPA